MLISSFIVFIASDSFPTKIEVRVAVKTPMSIIPAITRITVRIQPAPVIGLWISAKPPVTNVVKLHQILSLTFETPMPLSLSRK